MNNRKFLIFTLLLLSIFYFLFKVISKNVFLKPKDQPFIEIKGMHIYGFDKGKLSWQATIKKSIVSNDKKTITLHKIGKGTFYKRNGKINFYAEKGIYNLNTKNLTLLENILLKTNDNDELKTSFVHWDELTKTLSSTAPIELLLGKNKFFSNKFSAYKNLDLINLEGEVRIILNEPKDSAILNLKEKLIEHGVNNDKVKNLFIKSDSVKYDKKNEIIYCSSNSGRKLEINKKEINIKAKDAIIKLQYKIAIISGEVSFLKKGQGLSTKKGKELEKILTRKNLLVNTEYIEYNWDNEITIFPYDLNLIREGLTLTANRGVFLKDDESFYLDGNVNAKQTSSDWLKQEDFYKDIEGDKKYFEKETNIKCNHLSLSTDKGDLKAEGNIEIIQKDTFLKSNYLTYTENQKKWELQNNVFIKSKEGEINCNNIIIKDKQFTAKGNIQLNIELEEDFRKKLQEHFSIENKKVKTAKITADEIYYDREKKIAELKKNSTFYYADLLIKANYIFQDENKKIIKISENISLASKKYSITCNKMEIYLNKNLTVSKGNVKATQLLDKNEKIYIETDFLKYKGEQQEGYCKPASKIIYKNATLHGGEMNFSDKNHSITLQNDVNISAEDLKWLVKEEQKEDKLINEIIKKKTTITCYYAKINTEEKNSLFSSNVIIIQDGKELKADFFSIKEKDIIGKGNIFLNQESGEWIISAGLIDKDDEDIKNKLGKKVKIKSNELKINTEKSIYNFKEDVFIEHGDGEAKSESAIFESKEGIIHLFGQVRVKETEGSWMQAEKALINLKEDYFEAQGKVSALGKEIKKSEEK